MRWRQIGPHTIESDAGYCILQATANGVPTGRFVAFIGRTTKTTMPIVLGGYDSSADAKSACETHFAQIVEARAI